MRVDYESRFRLYENGTVTITSGRSPYTDEHREKVKQNGKRVKTYKIDTRIYRKIVSSSVNLYRNKVNRIIFLTLTFPGYIGEKEANICFSKFMDNLKTNYDVKNLPRQGFRIIIFLLITPFLILGGLIMLGAVLFLLLFLVPKMLSGFRKITDQLSKTSTEQSNISVSTSQSQEM